VKTSRGRIHKRKESVIPRLTRNVHRSVDAGLGRIAALALLTVLPIWNPAHAQNRPPLPGEPVATEGTIQQFYRGMNFMVVKTIDGVEHVYNFTKDLIVHGGKNPGSRAWKDCARERPWPSTFQPVVRKRQQTKSTSSVMKD
jgi:hypothetical protein